MCILPPAYRYNTSVNVITNRKVLPKKTGLIARFLFVGYAIFSNTGNNIDYSPKEVMAMLTIKIMYGILLAIHIKNAWQKGRVTK